MTIYFAHHLWKYNTEIELYEMALIRKAFPDAIIVNPNTDIEQHKDEAEIMTDCIEAARSCDAVVFSSVSGVIGKGVFDEIASAKAVYYIKNNGVVPFAGAFQIIPDSTTKRIYATVMEDDDKAQTSLFEQEGK